MLAKFEKENRSDENGNPTGGSISGVGLAIDWQDGPLGRGKNRAEPNGAFVETVIAAAKSRLEFYQESKFACEYNENAILALQLALNVLNQRTIDREKRQVEGEHKV
jgi:hypothetical protein